jgi:hypothetical protein
MVASRRQSGTDEFNGRHHFGSHASVAKPSMERTRESGRSPRRQDGGPSHLIRSDILSSAGVLVYDGRPVLSSRQVAL